MSPFPFFSIPPPLTSNTPHPLAVTGLSVYESVSVFLGGSVTVELLLSLMDARN